MTLKTVSPESQIDNPDDDQIIDALRKLYDDEDDAVILIVDKENNLFMQMGGGGWHVEHCVSPKGPIYSAENVPIELACQMFLAYKRREDTWKSAVSWAVEIKEW